MKKEYINPEMQVVSFAAPVVLQSNSPGGVTNGSPLGNSVKDEGASLFAPSFDGGDSSEEW